MTPQTLAIALSQSKIYTKLVKRELTLSLMDQGHLTLRRLTVFSKSTV